MYQISWFRSTTVFVNRHKKNFISDLECLINILSDVVNKIIVKILLLVVNKCEKKLVECLYIVTFSKYLSWNFMSNQ